MKNKKISKRAELAFTQIFILMMSILAFGYVVGSINPVSAQEVSVPKNIKEFGTPGMLGYINAVYSTPVKIGTTSRDLIKGVLTEKASKEAAVTAGTEVAKSSVTSGESLGGLAGFINEKIGLSVGASTGIAAVLNGAAYASAAYLGVKYVAEKLGAKPGQSKALAAGAAVGIFSGTVIAETGLGKILSAAIIPGAGWIIAGVLTIFVTLFSWKDEKQAQVIFTCDLWQPQSGGKNCDKCNSGSFPCSAYQCSSLGVSCRIVNEGTKEQKCIWVDRNNVTAPLMSPWEEALKEGYLYSPNNVISLPDRGVFVKYTGAKDGCIPTYTSFTFGVKVSMEAKCRADIISQKNFSDMRIPLSGERYLEGHEITLAYPNMKDLEAENIINISGSDKDRSLYVRCMNGNGIATNAYLKFSYCINDVPDLNAPKVVETNPEDGAYIRFGASYVENFVALIDKPGQCKWSTLDRIYDDMENTMSCATKVTQSNTRSLYNCKANLTGIKDRVDNNFYFRCKGTYNNKTSTESYKVTLKGTEPLVITKVGPNETIKDSTDPVKVTLTAETSAGAENGKATCAYSATGYENDYFTFYNTDSYTHSQPDLGLSAGKYTYYIKCFDAGGNSEVKTTNFTVEVDRSPPVVVRAFHDGNNLKIITNEEAECVYDITNCKYDFKDGIKMTDDEKEHTVTWDTYNSFYIKCKDEYENQPNFDQCSLEVRPFNLA